ncbi:vomeronasal type-1 receptor 4-like [Grammomys surdaster]|uniref:vomeronasal type-1 receptor 4-like n=1 Tax=Grammomys surdaster TaxID=491861 RepID=UPI0010A0B080|nr:vomeronasal type-1 receptor 4-like [Grammomys surdaster]
MMSTPSLGRVIDTSCEIILTSEEMSSQYIIMSSHLGEHRKIRCLAHRPLMSHSASAITETLLSMERYAASSERYERLASRDMIMGIFFLSQTVLGVVGNSALLCCFIITDFNGIRTKPTDRIVKHLTWANIMVVLCKGIPQTMTAFGHTCYLDDSTCKLVFYLHRVSRGFSLGSTCLLSVFQAITISPINFKYVHFKARIPKIIGPSLVLCWSLCLLVHIFMIMTVTDMRNEGNLTEFRQLLYCTAVIPFKHVSTVYVIILASSDVICLGLMMWTSGYMVLFLFKHKQRVQYIHRSLATKSFHETKATQSIVILVSSFVALYGTSFILMMYLSFQSETGTCLVNVNVAMSACFPVLCPFLLTRNFLRVFKLCST